MKKLIMLMLSVVLVFNLIGCGNDYSENENQTSESLEQYEVDKENEVNVVEDEFIGDSIKVENGVAYFDMSVSEFVEAYNKTLTDESEYIAKRLINAPNYSNSGIGVQQIDIYQYDVSNGLGSIQTFVHTNENGKIVELVIGIEKVLGKVNVDLNDALYSYLGEMTLSLTNIDIWDWGLLADGLKREIENKSPSLHYYYKGVLLDAYSNEIALYFRISCMTEEMYNKLS